jgi:hypothetical protein
MKKIKSLMVAAALMLAASQSFGAVLNYSSSIAANAGTNVLFTNAVVLTSVTFFNTGGTNFNFALFNSAVRSNQFAVPVYTNITYVNGFVTNTVTNIVTGVATNNYYAAILATTNTDLATNRTYPILFQSTITTNTGAGVSFTLNQLYTHGICMTNNQQAAGSVTAIFQYLTPQ